jgi:hypothetical protein
MDREGPSNESTMKRERERLRERGGVKRREEDAKNETTNNFVSGQNKQAEQFV